jgi:hypothetical protein
MKMTNLLDTADALSDQDLLARVNVLAARERESTAELVAHLAALDARPSLYAAKGYSSLFAYCTEALRLSEDATCNRTEVARACRRFPEILDRLASGELNLTSARVLTPHLTPGNVKDVLARASGRRRREIDLLIAELHPRPDAPTLIRRLPTPATSSAPNASPSTSESGAAIPAPPAVVALTPRVMTPTPRPAIQPTAPERYRVQFTVGQATHDKPAAAAGTAPPRDPERRSRRHRRPSADPPPGEGRKGQVWRRGEAATGARYPS